MPSWLSEIRSSLHIRSFDLVHFSLCGCAILAKTALGLPMQFILDVYAGLGLTFSSVRTAIEGILPSTQPRRQSLGLKRPAGQSTQACEANRNERSVLMLMSKALATVQQVTSPFRAPSLLQHRELGSTSQSRTCGRLSSQPSAWRKIAKQSNTWLLLRN